MGRLCKNSHVKTLKYIKNQKQISSDLKLFIIYLCVCVCEREREREKERVRERENE